MLSIASIKTLLAAELPSASAEVHNFISWIENKDAELRAAETEFTALVERQKVLAATLLRAGYTVNAGTMTAPAQ